MGILKRNLAGPDLVTLLRKVFTVGRGLAISGGPNSDLTIGQLA